MKNMKKMTAALLCGGLMLSAMPLTPVSAEGEPAEAVTMNAVIKLNETTATAEGENVTVDGTNITISASGAYEFSGTLNDGQIIVYVPDETADPGTVKIFFNGVNITGVSEAPLYIINAEKTSINLMDGTENFLADGGLYTNTNAVITAKDDITIKAGGETGDGKLTITSAYQHGIHCNNDVKISGGIIKIRTSEGDGMTTGIGDGIRGKTSVEIKDGDIDVNAGGDGVKSTKGDVFISGGHTEIKAGNDAVQGETSVQISGGSLKANGDRGLTNAAATGITITGGEILATATDNQMTVADASTQPVLLFNTATEQVKDQAIELKDAASGESVFSKKPDKKFDYVLISSAALAVGKSYELYVGGAAVENSKFTFETALTTLNDVVCTAAEGQPVTEKSLDINVDDCVDVADAVLLSRLLAEDPDVIVSEVGRSRLDTNGDGTFDAADVIVVLRKIAHLD